jgi:hypothetical protein
MKDKCAWIIGNGPSLTPEILDKLKGKHTFAVNRIAKIFDRTDWRPEYYVAVTDAIHDPRHREDIERAMYESENVYCWNKYPEHLPGIRLNCSETEDIQTEDVDDSIWSDDIMERVSKFGVSAFPAMQIAVYLGFTTLCLIGCDGGYRPVANGVDLSHFDGGYRNFDAYALYDYDRLNGALERAHEITQSNCDRLGVEVVNLSPNSKVKAHKFGELEDYL